MHPFPHLSIHRAATAVAAVTVLTLGCGGPLPTESPVVAQALLLQGEQTLEGRIETTVFDDFARGLATVTRTLVTPDGQRYRLELGDRPVPGRRGQTVRVRGTVSGDTLAVAAGDATAVQVVEGGFGTAAVPHGIKKLAVVLVKFSDDPSMPHTVQQMREWAFTAPDSVNNYYREISRGRVGLTGHLSASGDVVDWVNVPPSSSCGEAVDAANVALEQQDFDLTPYDNVMYIMPGMAPLCASHAWDNRSVITWVEKLIMAHELGHNFGIGHADGWSCQEPVVSSSAAPPLHVPLSSNCSLVGYADTFDIMGLGYRHTSPFHKWTLDYLAPSNLAVWSASGDFTLAPSELNTTAMQMLRVPRPAAGDGSFFQLEVRRPMGLFDNFAPSDPVVDGVSVRLGPGEAGWADLRLIDMRPETSEGVEAFNNAALPAGQAFFDEQDRYAFHVLSVGSAGATVRVLGNRTPIKINFQPAASPVPAGYLVDGGAAFGNRGNGQSYGWNVDNAVNARDRNSTATPGGDQRYDTLNHMQKTPGATTWELAVPSGPYWVRIATGDTSTDSVFKTTVEGVLVIDATPSAEQRWFHRSGVVNVQDGRLTVTSGAGAVNNKICFIEVVSLAMTAGDTVKPTVSITAPVSNATVSGTAVTVSASASDNVGVVGVQLKLDGANLGAEDTSSPYNTSWNTTLVASGVHRLEAVARDAAGNSTTSAAVVVVVGNSSGAFVQGGGADGIVAIEAEHYASKISRASKDWTFASEAAAAGAAVMACLPDTGGNINTGYATTSPQLNFRVNFVRTGTHHVWVRGRAPNDAADSLHIGIDGSAPTSADRITGFGTAFGWSKNTMDGVVATINVSSTGLHTINVWMREDGMVLDKLVLTSNAGFTPTATGPAESNWAP